MMIMVINNNNKIRWNFKLLASCFMMFVVGDQSEIGWNGDEKCKIIFGDTNKNEHLQWNFNDMLCLVYFYWNQDQILLIILEFCEFEWLLCKKTTAFPPTVRLKPEITRIFINLFRFSVFQCVFFSYILEEQRKGN